MPFPDRYRPKPERPHLVKKILDSHLIGLQVDKNFVYDLPKLSGERNGEYAETVGEDGITRHPIPPDEKIKNYAILAPNGKMGKKLFFHGKELLNEAQAHAIFDGNMPVETLHFAPHVIEKAAKMLKPESFSCRINDYSYRNNPSLEAMNKMAVDSLREEFPHIDFSSLPKIEETTLSEFANALIMLLEKNDINSAEVHELISTGSYTSIPKIGISNLR